MPRAIVVGSGAAGGTVARLLAKSGQYTVLVLEKGRNHFTGLGGDTAAVSNEFSNDEGGWGVMQNPIYQDPWLEPRSFRFKPQDGKRTFVGDVNNLPTTVGGGTIHYDAKARRFREVDFITNSLMGGTPDKPAVSKTTYADWPMQYKHLEPFYAVMEEVVGVQGPARRVNGKVVNPNPYESYRSTPFPMPPGVGMYSNIVQAEAATRLGYSPAPVPTSVNSRPYRGRAACIDCAHCLSYGCPNNAKGGGVWQLQDALQTRRVELRSQCHVLRVERSDKPGPSGRFRATGVTYADASGAMHTELADLVVLANSAIEATRLSLLSGIGTLPTDTQNDWGTLKSSATDPAGMLGRNLMFHLQTEQIGIFSTDIHPWRGRTSSHTLDAFAGAGPTPDDFNKNPGVPRGGITELGGNQDPIGEAISLMALLYGEGLKEELRTSPLRRHLAAFTMQGEDMPQATNVCDLDPDIVDVFGQRVPRITYSSHPYEIEAVAYYSPKLLEIMNTIGGPGSQWPTLKAVGLPLGGTAPSADLPAALALVTSQAFNQIPASKHIMGTHRMSLDQEHGVTDPYGRYWAFDNLYHAGGGLYVTAPGFNVTLTIWALSYWVATAILSGVDGAAKYDAAAVDKNWQRQLCVLRTLDADTMISRVLGGSCGPPTVAAARTMVPVSVLPNTGDGPGGVAAVAAAGVAGAAALVGRARRRAEGDRPESAETPI